MAKSKQKKLQIVLRIIALCCVGIFFGVNVYFWNAKSLTGNVLPMPFGVGMAVVLTGSMEPELSVDDLILVVEQDSYDVGDIVVYQSSGSLIVHRIVTMNGTVLVTKGDANNVEDAEIDVSYIKGKVIGHLDQVGLLVRLMKKPVVSVVLILGAIVLMERSYRKEKEQGDAELDKIKAEIRALKAQQEEQAP